MSEHAYELFPTVLIRAKTMEAADERFADLIDSDILGNDVRIFGWTTRETGDAALEVFEAPTEETN